MEKIWKNEKLREYIDLDEFSGSIDKVIGLLSSIEKRYIALGYRNIELKMEPGWDSVECDFYGQRLETDKELEARVRRSDASKKAAGVAKTNKENKEKKELARLVEKYGVPK